MNGVMKDIVEISGVNAVIHMANDGSVIGQCCRKDIVSDLEAHLAQAAVILHTAKALAKRLTLGGAEICTLEYQKGRFVLASGDSESLLLIQTTPGANLAAIRMAISV